MSCLFLFFVFLNPAPSDSKFYPQTLLYDGEIRLANVVQLTSGGVNAEAYFSFDGKKILYQGFDPHGSHRCDQIYLLNLENLTAGPQLISDGRGQTTCSFFFPDNSSFIYSTTSKAGAECPKSVCEGSSPPKQCNNSYIWNIFNGFNILLTDSTGKTHYLTDDSFYNAEGAVSPDGKSIVFTSTRGGDLDLWLMRLNGTEVVNITQLTDITGYDGGAFFSPLGDKIVYRAYHPKTAEEITNYFQLLNLSITKPLQMEIFTMNADGSDQKQVTNFGYASWAPYFYPDGSKIIFSSNHHGNHSVFNLFLIDQDGNNLEQITTNPGLDMFPMFSYDKKKLIFVSNRNGNGFNVFMADWIADSANLHTMSPMLRLFAYLCNFSNCNCSHCENIQSKMLKSNLRILISVLKYKLPTCTTVDNVENSPQAYHCIAQLNISCGYFVMFRYFNFAVGGGTLNVNTYASASALSCEMSRVNLLSFLGKKSVASLLTVENFSSLPADKQELLINLLPTIDQVEVERIGRKSNVLKNEYLAAACDQFKQRLISGDLLRNGYPTSKSEFRQKQRRSAPSKRDIDTKQGKAAEPRKRGRRRRQLQEESADGQQPQRENKRRGPLKKKKKQNLKASTSSGNFKIPHEKSVEKAEEKHKQTKTATGTISACSLISSATQAVQGGRKCSDVQISATKFPHYNRKCDEIAKVSSSSIYASDSEPCTSGQSMKRVLESEKLSTSSSFYPDYSRKSDLSSLPSTSKAFKPSGFVDVQKPSKMIQCVTPPRPGQVKNSLPRMLINLETKKLAVVVDGKQPTWKTWNNKTNGKPNRDAPLHANAQLFQQQSCNLSTNKKSWPQCEIEEIHHSSIRRDTKYANLRSKPDKEMNESDYNESDDHRCCSLTTSLNCFQY
ncbi:Protein TolB 2 [Trichinella murrelli]|uniref:Protein TolB 2 n=2 Tax=Trichinella murrelli TaxID=144512 RepID=A0A0V0TX43_9BILA|nr:Protein TolB 2 [Trichinella murrelli]